MQVTTYPVIVFEDPLAADRAGGLGFNKPEVNAIRVKQVFAGQSFDTFLFLKLAQTYTTGRGLLYVFELLSVKTELLDLINSPLSVVLLDSLDDQIDKVDDGNATPHNQHHLNSH